MTATSDRRSEAPRGHDTPGAGETFPRAPITGPDATLRATQEASGRPVRFAILSDIHLSPPGTVDGVWNNITKRSASASLLDAAVAQIVAAGHDRVLVLGDVSEFGATDMIAAALGTISDAGLRAWVVPGNHDVALSTNALSTAAETLTSSVALDTDHPRQCDGITVCGHGLRSRDGGQTCQATNLPDPARFHSRLLLSATHYPLLSQHARLRVAGLRYPGDLLNLDEARAAAERFQGPILVLHGHLHTAVIRHAGRILQIGSPAVVEWPHAWTDASIEVTSDTVRIRTALTPIPGQWSTGDLNTVVAEHEQNWAFSTGRWRRAGSAHSDG